MSHNWTVWMSHNWTVWMSHNWTVWMSHNWTVWGGLVGGGNIHRSTTTLICKNVIMYKGLLDCATGLGGEHE